MTEKCKSIVIADNEQSGRKLEAHGKMRNLIELTNIYGEKWGNLTPLRVQILIELALNLTPQSESGDLLARDLIWKIGTMLDHIAEDGGYGDMLVEEFMSILDDNFEA